MIEPWAAPLVTGAAIVFLGVTGAMGAWYSLRIAWWILRALYRGAAWLFEGVGFFVQDVVAEMARIVEDVTPTIEDITPRRVSPPAAPTSARPWRAPSESWVQIDHAAALAPAFVPLTPYEDRERRNWIIERARTVHGGGFGSIQSAARDWEMDTLRRERASLDALAAAGMSFAEAAAALARVGGGRMPLAEIVCDCEPDRYQVRTCDGSVVHHYAEHFPGCRSRRLGNVT